MMRRDGLCKCIPLQLQLSPHLPDLLQDVVG